MAPKHRQDRVGLHDSIPLRRARQFDGWTRLRCSLTTGLVADCQLQGAADLLAVRRRHFYWIGRLRLQQRYRGGVHFRVDVFGQFRYLRGLAMATVATSSNRTASLGSIQNFGGYIGGALAPTITGFIVQRTGSFRLALVTAAFIALAAVIGHLILVKLPIPHRSRVGAPTQSTAG